MSFSGGGFVGAFRNSRRRRVQAFVMRAIALRRYVPEDAYALTEAAHESWREVGPWMEWCKPDLPLREAEAWVAEQVQRFNEGTAYEFTIRDAGDGAYLGACGVNHIEPVNRYANLGYWVRTSATRQGVCQQAVKQLAGWIFGNTDLVRLEIVAAVGNAASQRAAEKAGAEREGTLRKRLKMHGLWHDAAIYSLTRDSVPTAP